MPFFLKGLILGFSIAAPVGPIGILCIRKTLQYGRLSGFLCGLGAAVADTVFGIIAAFGLTFISEFLIAGQFWLRIVGGSFLIYLGWKTFFAKVHEKPAYMRHQSLWKDFLSTFFLTLTNPLTILSYLAVFAGLGVANTQGNYLNATELVIGVFVGSALWWLLLSEAVTLFRKKISQPLMRWINRLAGLIILAFGMAAFLNLF